MHSKTVHSAYSPSRGGGWGGVNAYHILAAEIRMQRTVVNILAAEIRTQRTAVNCSIMKRLNFRV